MIGVFLYLVWTQNGHKLILCFRTKLDEVGIVLVSQLAVTERDLRSGASQVADWNKKYLGIASIRPAPIILGQDYRRSGFK